MSTGFFHPQYPYDMYASGTCSFDRSLGRYTCNLSRPTVESVPNRLHISLARYKMAVHLKRRLLRTEHVDHIDNDRTNDTLSNLQILTKEENQRKHNATRASRLAIIVCPVCGRLFSRSSHNTPLAVYRQGQIAFCTRHCMGRYNRQPWYNATDVLSGQILFEVDEYSDGRVVLVRYNTLVPKEYMARVWCAINASRALQNHYAIRTSSP